MILLYGLAMNLIKKELNKIVKLALEEDVGKGDITSSLTIPRDKKGSFAFVARETLVVCGIPILETIFSKTLYKKFCKDGDIIKPGQKIFSISGNVRYILCRERVALNFIQHLSGISSLTKNFVNQTAGTKAKILDTRKTTPGLRLLEKYAVFIGGGTNHRMRLDDGILIKDNHIKAAGGIKSAVYSAKKASTKTIIVECDTISQVREAVEAGADRVLLDNMSEKLMQKVVEDFSGKVLFEASGGISLKNVRAVAKTGVDFISVGAITHSAKWMDIGLDEI